MKHETVGIEQVDDLVNTSKTSFRLNIAGPPRSSLSSLGWSFNQPTPTPSV